MIVAKIEGGIPKPKWNDDKVGGFTTGVALASALSVGLVVFFATRCVYKQAGDGATSSLLNVTPGSTYNPGTVPPLARTMSAPTIVSSV